MNGKEKIPQEEHSYGAAQSAPMASSSSIVPPVGDEAAAQELTIGTLPTPVEEVLSTPTAGPEGRLKRPHATLREDEHIPEPGTSKGEGMWQCRPKACP